jgi:site-specific DNA recombinase
VNTKRSTRAANPKRAVAYLRVSTTREQQELGISAQRAAIQFWAKREDVEVCAWYEEEVSGGASLEKRPVLLQAISALGDHGAGSLVVQRLDRFSRDPLGAAMAEIQVHRLGARVVTTDGVGNGDDPGSRLMKDVALAAARFERSMIAARTKAALAVKKSRGESTGTPPYGWRVGEDGKTLVADEAEQETARKLRALREQGWAYRQIRDEAARRGWASRAGKAFTLQAIFELVKDAAVATTTPQRGTEFPRPAGIAMEASPSRCRAAAMRQASGRDARSTAYVSHGRLVHDVHARSRTNSAVCLSLHEGFDGAGVRFAVDEPSPGLGPRHE